LWVFNEDGDEIGIAHKRVVRDPKRCADFVILLR